MAWFAAVLVIECSAENSDEYIHDKQIRLVHAASVAEAYSKAMQMGAEEELIYKNPSGHNVSWRFLGLNDLTELLVDDPHDGAEIYSTIGKGPGNIHVVGKDQLTAFWTLANLEKKVQDLLPANVEPFTPK